MILPINAGESVVATPASFKASYLLKAVPSLPVTIAPAWPILLPGGAETPAI